MPQDYEIATIVKDETWPGNDDQMRTIEMALKDVGQTVKATGKAKFNGPYNATKWPEQGDTIHGDIDGGKFKFAKSQNGSQPSPAAPSGQGRTDATGRSIERQVAAKIAGELIGDGYGSMSEEQFKRTFRYLTDAVHDAIQGGTTADAEIPFG